MLSEWDQEDIDSCCNFYNDIVDEINQIKKDTKGKTNPLLVSNWN